MLPAAVGPTEDRHLIASGRRSASSGMGSPSREEYNLSNCKCSGNTSRILQSRHPGLARAAAPRPESLARTGAKPLGCGASSIDMFAQIAIEQPLSGFLRTTATSRPACGNCP